MTLRARSFNGFVPVSSVGIGYISETESFSIYIHEFQICRITSEGDGVNVKISLEIFDVKLYSQYVKDISQIIALYQEL